MGYRYEIEKIENNANNCPIDGAGNRMQQCGTRGKFREADQ